MLSDDDTEAQTVWKHVENIHNLPRRYVAKRQEEHISHPTYHSNIIYAITVITPRKTMSLEAKILAIEIVHTKVSLEEISKVAKGKQPDKLIHLVSNEPGQELPSNLQLDVPTEKMMVTKNRPRKQVGYQFSFN